ncbi:MAG: peptidoglycan -binding protein [Kiloniellales bacterium]|nr:peptidoglycan -binding protein [Kiloniellales bacterium]
MYALGRGGSRRSINIWPGFVDGLATLLLVVIFVLMVFMVAQFFLSTALTSKDQALSRLEQQVSELGQILALERREVQSLQDEVESLSTQLYASLADRDRLSQDLATVSEERDSLAAALSQVERVLQDSEASQAEAEAEAARLAALIAEREAELAKVSGDLAEAYTSIDADKETIEAQLAELAILKSLRDEMTSQLNAVEAALAARDKELEEQGESLATAQAEATSLAARLAESEDERGVIALRLSEAERQVAERTQVSEEAQRKVTLLNKQILALRKQLASLSEALDLAEKRTREQDVQIADLGRKLNLALATKVQELARYRSEFFGELRKVLGNQPGVRVVGDRFVFQSEVLFASGSAELGAEGRSQLSALGKTLKQISARFPKDVDWILRVDGHTDRRPISTAEFASNWELSTSRAISVVKYLVSQGIPSQRLAATGFGEFQPIDSGDDEIAFRRNRRIELKLTQR